ncbi:MAG: aminotransferase class I/II-fold pyridoxal phosphate-dependent enzyme, partial [Gemmatimonadetes bacterium]|nr:aminotransferase class I/II-fold pyridoxal phosphate-dependent enzyme [Gemmatimonadota bacterium]
MKRIVIDKSERYHRVVSHPMEELLPSRRRAEKRLGSVIDLSVMESDMALPSRSDGAAAPADDVIRETIAKRLLETRSLRLDPRREILLCDDVESSLEDLALAFIDPSDVVLIPDPALPLYRRVCVLAGGWPIPVPLSDRNDGAPEWERVEPEATRRAKMLWFASPHLPTGKIASHASIERLVERARRDNVLVVQDARLASTCRSDLSAPGLLDHPHGRGVGVEAHELAPWHGGGERPGFLIGNREVIEAVRTLGRLRRRPGVPGRPRLQDAFALSAEDTAFAKKTFARRMDTALGGLRELDWAVQEPDAGFALWVRVPTRFHSLRFSAMLLRAGIAVVPGIAFGEFGHDSVLLSLTTTEENIREGFDRLRKKFPGRWGVRSWR